MTQKDQKEDKVLTKLKAPSFQFFPQDFVLGVRDMTTEEVGAYILLLCEQWDKKGLPNDDRKLAAIAGIKPAKLAPVKEKFALNDDGKLRNGRLEREREKQKINSEKRAAAANEKWEKERQKREQEQQQNDANASDLQIQNGDSAHALQFHTTITVSDNNTLSHPAGAREEDENAGQESPPESDMPAVWNPKPWYDQVPDPPPATLEAVAAEQYRKYRKKVLDTDVLAFWKSWRVIEVAGDKAYQSLQEVYRHFANSCKRQDLSTEDGQSAKHHKTTPETVNLNSKPL